jgi:predicted GIY-YIG superfamily endonuclease
MEAVLNNNILWTEVQNNSDKILAGGLWELINKRPRKLDSNITSLPGNYLISVKKTNLYIGQAKNVKSRIKQHNKDKSSLYANYLKKNIGKYHLKKFNLRFINTDFGRKEIEEVGIPSLKTLLNKSHKNKREPVIIINKKKSWRNIQNKKTKIMKVGERVIFNKKIIKWLDADLPKYPGVYIVFNDKRDIIYIGESSVLSRRYHMHSNRTYISALRRHIGKEIFHLKFIKKREFSKSGDKKVDNYLSTCGITHVECFIGRLEFEEYLIKKYSPKLNKKI